jgi:hypothetical protein
MLSLGLVATVQAKAQKDTVQMDSFTPVSEQIRRVETAMGSEDYSEIGLEDKSRVQQALNRIRIKMNGREKVDELAAGAQRPVQRAGDRQHHHDPRPGRQPHDLPPRAPHRQQHDQRLPDRGPASQGPGRQPPALTDQQRISR